MPSDIKLLVFDLDGTLIDSRLDLAHSVNAILSELRREKLPLETVVSFVGDGAQDLLRRSLQASGFSAEEAEAMLPRAFALFMEHYRHHCLDCTLPYPGVIAALEKFSAYRKAVLTNKPLVPTLKILEGLAMKDYFGLIVGGDGPYAKKPDPAGLAYILSASEALPCEAMMIGDSMQDMRAAKAAGCRFTAYLSGMGDAADLRAANPDFAIKDFSELAGVLAEAK